MFLEKENKSLFLQGKRIRKGKKPQINQSQPQVGQIKADKLREIIEKLNEEWGENSHDIIDFNNELFVKVFNQTAQFLEIYVAFERFLGFTSIKLSSDFFSKNLVNSLCFNSISFSIFSILFDNFIIS